MIDTSNNNTIITAHAILPRIRETTREFLLAQQDDDQ
jgi:hypothetical protein